jgi:hypothetical protein
MLFLVACVYCVIASCKCSLCCSWFLSCSLTKKIEVSTLLLVFIVLLVVRANHVFVGIHCVHVLASVHHVVIDY